MDNKGIKRDLDVLMQGLKAYDVTGIFTRFLAALVDNGCPVEAIVKAIRAADVEGAGL